MSLILKRIYRFEDFELNCVKRTLLREGQPVALSPKAFEVLTYLVIHPGRVLTKEELIQADWPESFVEEGNLAQQVASLRRAFADRAGCIVTIPGRGYQFTADVVPDKPALPDQSLLSDESQVVLQTVRERTRIVMEEGLTHPLQSAKPRGTKRSTRVSLWAVAGVAAVAVAAFAGWKLTHRPSYGHAEAVIADLDNETGDTEFDHSLNRMLQIDLQQSPYFTVVGQGRARGILKMMRQPVDERITAPLAREICQRLNGKVYLTPAIAKVGDRYLLSLEANDCADGHSLGSADNEASSKGKVLAAFAAVTRQVRRDAGESRASIEHFDKPLFSTSTASLDALKAYSEATRFALSGQFADAIALYHHAIELDPNFAAAYADMGAVFFNMGDDENDREATTKAYALRDSVNEYERLFIEYGYHSNVTGDLQAELEALRQWTGTYPQDPTPLGALIGLETTMGQYPAAAASADRMLDLERRGGIHDGISYEMAIRAYHRANMPDKVRAVYTEALRSNAETEGLHDNMLEFSAENGDAAGVDREIAWSRGKPEECRVLQTAGLAALAAGQAQRAETLFVEANSAALRDKLQDTLADFEDYRARMLVEVGLAGEARALLSVLPQSDTEMDKVFTEAEVGNAAEALAEAQRRQVAAPNGTLLNAVYLPSVRAVVALRQGKPDEAVSLLQSAAPFELHDPIIPYLRGQAYLAAHQASQAKAEFEEIADHPWLADPAASVIALAHLGIARASAMEGNSSSARSEYQRFLTLWKDADSNLPVLQQARLEYERIR